MEYKELSKIYYMDQSASREDSLKQEYARRFNADSTFRLGFETPQGELFLAVPRELSVLTENVFRSERTISALMQRMPGAASSAVLRGLVLDEVVCTNEIEDIHSTRRQIKDALEAEQGAPSEVKRFRELTMLYLSIIDGKAEMPSTPEAVRSLYDEVTKGGVSPDALPDGVLFRAQGVDVVQSGGRVVHSGLEPEGRIIEALEKMLDLAHSFNIPSLYRAVIVHYLFECIHPFYDGNGRTGRYLLSLMLEESLSPATALSLSRVIAENRENYYRAFKTAEKSLNCSELTFFVHALLELILESQICLAEKLRGNLETLDRIDAIMEEIHSLYPLKEQEESIVYMLLQYEAFGLFGDAPLKEIADYLGLKEQMTRRHLSSLEEKGIACKRKKRNPVSFALTEEFKAKFGMDGLRD